MNVLDFEPDTEPVASTQAISASTLLHKAEKATSFALDDAALDELFQAPDSLTAGLPANHVLEISSAPGLGKTRWCMMFAVHALLQADGVEPKEVLFVGASSYVLLHFCELSADTEGQASPVELYKLALRCAQNDQGARDLLSDRSY
jgi:hypothetical protein